jgi:hypothetical protein
MKSTKVICHASEKSELKIETIKTEKHSLLFNAGEEEGHLDNI